MNADNGMRRSFVARCIPKSGSSEWTNERGHSALRLCDLSTLPRWGIKGRGTFPWLQAALANIPLADNRAQRQADGALIARLSTGEALILPPLPGGHTKLAKAIEALPPEGLGACYPAPRRDSHCWFALTGAAAPRMFAKLCAVDLAADQFTDGAIAQTSVARLSAIVIRHDDGDAICFFLLAESASAEYLWDCLLDAMAEFSGKVAKLPERDD